MCDHYHSLVDFALSGYVKSWAETMKEGFTLQCLECWKVDCLTAEIARLTDIVKGMEMRITKGTGGIESDDMERGRKEQCSDKKDEVRRLGGGRTIARKTNEERTTENVTCRKVTREKVTVEEGGTMGQERREVHVTGGKMKGRKEVRVDLLKAKSITRILTGRKEAGKKETTEKAAEGKVNDQVDAKRRSYSEVVIEGALITESVFMGDSILRKTDTIYYINQGRCCCLFFGG